MSIPVRNIWWLMLYASDLGKAVNPAKLATEDLPEHIPNLLAQVLAQAVEQRQRRQLSTAVLTREAVLSRVRGRIDHLTTARHQLLAKGQVACRFEALSIDSPRNRYVRTALETIARLVKSPALSHRCLALLEATDGLLCDTRQPRIFAESEVAGDGSDWTLTELGLMGDTAMALPVMVFDNGDHTHPVPHATPFPAMLLFTAGALLRNDRGHQPADWQEVVAADGSISPTGLLGLYRRRLLPLLRFVNGHAGAPRSAVVTVPGLGCGQFAGPFQGSMGAQLERVLRQLLQESAAELRNLRALHFDPYSECRPSRESIGGILFQVRPSRAASLEPLPQLCPPQAYAGPDDDFRSCRLYSLVAWDPVSWPGNDFYGGARCTDDGVKAAATDAMARITGVTGTYDPEAGLYRPPAPCRHWGAVVADRQQQAGLRLWNPAGLREGSG